MKAVACSGNRYLLSVEDDIEKANADPMARGQVLDTAAGILFPPDNLHSVYSKGYWTDCDVAPAQLAEWLKNARPLATGA